LGAVDFILKNTKVCVVHVQKSVHDIVTIDFICFYKSLVSTTLTVHVAVSVEFFSTMTNSHWSH